MVKLTLQRARTELGSYWFVGPPWAVNSWHKNNKRNKRTKGSKTALIILWLCWMISQRNQLWGISYEQTRVQPKDLTSVCPPLRQKGFIGGRGMPRENRGGERGMNEASRPQPRGNQGIVQQIKTPNDLFSEKHDLSFVLISFPSQGHFLIISNAWK